jgi:hypothetical protein
MTLHLTEQSASYVSELADQLPADQRHVFHDVVNSRLGSGRPVDNTVARVASIVFNEIRRGTILKRG